MKQTKTKITPEINKKKTDNHQREKKWQSPEGSN